MWWTGWFFTVFFISFTWIQSRDFIRIKKKKKGRNTQKGFRVYLKEKQALGSQFNTFSLSSHPDMLWKVLYCQCTLTMWSAWDHELTRRGIIPLGRDCVGLIYKVVEIHQSAASLKCHCPTGVWSESLAKRNFKNK